MEDVTIHVEAEINPTESEEKVKRAIENIFGDLQTHVEPIYREFKIFADAKGLEPLARLFNLLRRERIRAAAKTALLQGLEERSLRFSLNKQVAYAGHVSFANETAESPLGPIRVKIETKNPREIIEWLTSRNP